MKYAIRRVTMALVLGTLVLTAAPGLAQETGSAVKGAPINPREIKSHASTGSFHPTHKRLQKNPHNLPVEKSAQTVHAQPLATAQSITAVEPHTLSEPSPSPSFSFPALGDNGEVVPPDTFGAVGPTHLVVACASELRISDRAGNPVSTISQEQFWAGVGTNIFDTRVVFDPYGQRFIMTAAADPGGVNPRLCIAVSSSSNPTGTWYRWSEDVDAVSPVYADSPTLGFNKTWIVVQANMYNKSSFQFFRSEVYAYNKANLYANGTGQRTKLFFDSSFGDSQVPATMYDSTNAVVYFVANWNGNSEDSGFLRLFSLSGGIGSERLNVTNSFGEAIFVEVFAPWAEIAPNDADFLPQLGTANKIYASDSRIQNVHFRDGILYAAQTVFLPAAAPTRAAVQWWSITAGTGFIRHFGRVEDPGGTAMFAYPSIAANRYHDVLLGYSRFSPTEYASVAYSFRQDTDPTDELRGQIILKAGDTNYYEAVFGQNRWGDWSATTVDPVNDADLWTIQEYAAPRSPAGGSRWGTWWGRVSPPVDLGASMTAVPDRVPSGNQITYSMIVSNKQDEVLSGLRLQDTLPTGATFVSATPSKGSCGHTNGVLSCLFGPMSEFEQVTLTMTVNAGPPGFATNRATVFANGPDFNTTDNTAIAVTEIVNSADLQVLGSDSPDPVHVGNALAYTITISNRGPSTASGVLATSTVPASLTIGTITASQGIWNINGNVVTFTLGSINLGTAATITINCTANTPGLITNQVQVGASTFDGTPANNTVNIAGRVNARPVINPVGTQTINEDVQTVIPVTISDAETAAGSLQFSATSSNPALIPNANIVPGGSGQNRTLTITSATNQFGSNTTIIIMTVTDSDGASTTANFPINVAAVNDAPAITSIPGPPAIDEDTFTTVNFNISDIDSPLNSLTLSANSSNPTLLPIANITFSPSGSARTATLTPATNRSGSVNVTIIVSDGSLSSSNSFTLTVNPINDPPTISSIGPQATPEDTQTAAIPFTVSDPETLATNLQVTASSGDTTLVPNANIALLNLGTNRTVRVTPASNLSGTASITVRVSDGTNAVTTTFDLTITSVNDRPTLTQPSNITTNEDSGVITVQLTGIGSGAPNESDPLSVHASTTTPDLVENLQVAYNSPASSGTLTFNLVANANGTASIDVTVSDGVIADDLTRTFQVIINAVNDPPTIDLINDITVLEDSGQRSITLTGISAGAPNETAQTVSITATSSAPSVVPDPQIVYSPGASTATLNFTPVANASGSAIITVTVNDSRPQNPITTRTFQITVDPVNDLPTVSTIADRRINEDTSTGTIPFNFGDVEPGPLNVIAFSSNQLLAPDANVELTGTGTNRNLKVTPAPNEFGSATITIQVSDSQGGVTNRTFVLTVDPINDPPTLTAIPTPILIDEDAPAQTINLSGISPGPLNEATQQVRITATSSNPAIVPDPTVNYVFPSATGSLTYIPVANATGSVVITVKADDGEAANNTITRTFTVQINPVNDPPTITGAFDEDKFTDEDVPFSMTFSIGDIETAIGSLSLRGSSSNPELVADTNITFITGTGGNRTVTVRPLTNEFGTTFITITVTDGNNAETEVGFVLFVNEVDDPPMLSTIATQTISEDSATSTLPFWMDDVDSSVPSLSVTAHSLNQAMVPDSNIILDGTGTNRTVRVNPAPDANGSVNIVLTASDGNGTRTSQFTLNINGVNDAPTIADIPTQNILEDAGLQELTLNIGPGAANETTDVLTVTAASTAPGLIPNPIGTNVSGAWKLRFTPIANASGTANITVTVNDGRSVNPTNSKSFTVNVQAVNDPPTLNTIATLNLNEDAPQQNLTLTGISAGGGENQALAVTASSSNPTLVNPSVFYTNGNSTASLRFTVPPNASGSATVTVRVFDGVDETNQMFVVNVNPVNEPPVFLTTIGTLSTPEDTPISAQFTIGDEETYAARLSLTATSSVPTIVANTNIIFNGSDSNRWVTMSPVTNASGLTRITIIASDGTNTSTMSFNLTVNATNDPPTLNPLPNLVLTQNPANQTINLSGITSGASNENQTNVIRVTSSNPSLIPAPSSVTYTSPNLTGSFVLNPDNQATGSSLITVTVWDNGSPSNSFSQTFTVYVRLPANSLPTLTGLSNRTTLEDTPVTIPFTIGDDTTPAANLTVGVLSSNPDLVPTNAILFSGVDTSRSMMITPLPDRTGTSSITVWVLDSEFGYTSSNFVLQVTAANDAPTISSITPQTIDRGASLPPIPFTVTDAETPGQNLNVTASSSNQGLLPNSNIVIGGSGTNRSVMAYPLPGQVGSANITLTVTDANSASANTAFLLTVRAAQPPTLAIRRVGPNVELRWPTDAGLFTIQGRDQINIGNWSDISATPIVNGTNYVVTQLIAGPNKFFRLRN